MGGRRSAAPAGTTRRNITAQTPGPAAWPLRPMKTGSSPRVETWTPPLFQASRTAGCVPRSAGSASRGQRRYTVTALDGTSPGPGGQVGPLTEHDLPFHQFKCFTYKIGVLALDDVQSFR